MKDNGKKFIGEGKAYSLDGVLISEESYRLEAVRNFTSSGEYQFCETKIYADGLKREIIFAVDPNGRPYNYSDNFKTIKGFYPKDGFGVGFQKWQGFSGYFSVNFDENKLETITFSENRVFVETLSSTE